MSELNIPGFIAFLRGEVTIDGHWFGGDGPIRGGIRRNFWWREHLPKLSAHIERQDAEIAQLRADLSESRRLLDEARAQKPAIFFPRQPNGDGGWVIDANYVAAIRKDCFPIEWQPCEEEVEAVLLAVERAAPVPAQPAAVPELVRYCCSCQSVGEVDPRSVSCCPDAPGSVGYVSARFASRLAREFNVVRNGSAAVPEAVAKDVIPAGWVFYSADASIQSSNPRRPMTAMIKRDVDGVQWWLQLTEEEKERTSLYSTGAGMTLTLAIQNAVDTILSAADTEVKKDDGR